MIGMVWRGLGDFFFAHRRGFSLFYAFGAFGHEQNADGGEDDLQILYDARIGDVHQIHLELIIGRGIILAVDLRIAGQTRLCLKAQAEFRNFAFVLAGNFGALRSGADHAHAAAEDIEQLRQFIQPARAEHAADRRDSIIIFTGGKARDAILFGVGAHASEFQNVKRAAILGEPLLSVKYGAAVLRLYRDGDAQHQRAGDQNHDRAGHDIKRALDQQIFRRGAIALHAKHRQMEHMHPLRAAHDYIADARDHIGIDSVRHAVFQNLVPFMALHAAEENRVQIIQIAHIRAQACLRRAGALHRKALAQPVLTQQVGYIAIAIINHEGFLPGKAAEIPDVRIFTPEKAEKYLPRQRRQRGQKIGKAAAHQPERDKHKRIRHEDAQQLTEEQIRNTLERDQKRIVHAAEEGIQQRKEQNHTRAAQRGRAHDHPIYIIEQPTAREGGDDQKDIEQLHQPKANIIIQPLRRPLTLDFWIWRMHMYTRSPVFQLYLISDDDREFCLGRRMFWLHLMEELSARLRAD